MCSIGYETLVFSVTEASLEKSTLPSLIVQFSIKALRLIAPYISGSCSLDRSMHLA